MNWDAAGDPEFFPQLRQTAAKMAGASPAWRTVEERVRETGEDPRAVLAAFGKLVAAVLRNGGMLAGHNIINFDMPFLRESARDLEMPFPEIPPDRIIDTAGVEKLLQLPSPPPPFGTASAYWKHVIHRSAPGVKYKLDGHCFEKYGWDVAAAEFHAAEFDAVCVHRLVEEYRKLLVPGRPAPEVNKAAARPPEPAVRPVPVRISTVTPTPVRRQRKV